MCLICGKATCPATCPNAPEPPVVGVCMVCGEDIYKGDSIFKRDCVTLHTDCLYNFQIRDLLISCDLNLADSMRFTENPRDIMTAFGFEQKEAGDGNG